MLTEGMISDIETLSMVLKKDNINPFINLDGITQFRDKPKLNLKESVDRENNEYIKWVASYANQEQYFFIAEEIFRYLTSPIHDFEKWNELIDKSSKYMKSYYTEKRGWKHLICFDGIMRMIMILQDKYPRAAFYSGITAGFLMKEVERVKNIVNNEL